MSNNKENRGKNILIQCSVSLFLVFFLLINIDYGEDLDLEIHAMYLPLLVGTVICAYFSRARIYHETLGGNRLKISDWFWVTGFYNFVASLLPAGLGHLSFPYILRKNYEVSIGGAVGALGVYNLLRVALLTFLLVIALAVSEGVVVPINSPFLLAIVLLVGFFCGFIFVVSRRINTLKLEKSGRVGGELRAGINILKRGLEPKLLGRLALLAMIVICFNLGRVYFSYIFFGYRLAFVPVVLILCVTNLSNILPIHGFARLGSHEALNVLVLLSVGLSKSEAIKLSFAVHFLQLSIEAVLALLSYLAIFVRGTIGLSGSTER